MKASRFYVGFVVVAMAFGFEGCSSSSGGNTSKSGRSPTGECNSSSSSSEGSTCTGQEAHDACIQEACGTQYQTCFGASYLSGSYAGTCKTEIECLFACSCEDTACAVTCYTNASAACADCFDAIDSCEQQSGCAEPVCGTSGVGGTSSTGSTTGQGGTNSTLTSSGGTTAQGGGSSTATGSGGSTAATVCPYTTASFDCTEACTNLKTVASKCQTDPSLSADIQAILTLANSGNGTACKAGCAASSPSALPQWKCYQAVPTTADCTAIAGCTYANCPP